MMTIAIKNYKRTGDKYVANVNTIYDVSRVIVEDEEVFLYDEFGELINSKEEERLFAYDCDYFITSD